MHISSRRKIHKRAEAGVWSSPVSPFDCDQEHEARRQVDGGSWTFASPWSRRTLKRDIFPYQHWNRSYHQGKISNNVNQRKSAPLYADLESWKESSEGGGGNEIVGIVVIAGHD